MPIPTGVAPRGNDAVDRPNKDKSITIGRKEFEKAKKSLNNSAMEALVNELRKFSKDIAEFGDSIDDNRVEEFEKSNQLTLPHDFKEFIKRTNGLSLLGTEVYGFDKAEVNAIENIYHREHHEVNVPQYPHLVPFSPDGRGNFYCLDTVHQSDDGNFPIVFWVSNYQYSKEDRPEITHNSFFDWVKEIVIDWTLESYNCDGSEK